MLARESAICRENTDGAEVALHRVVRNPNPTHDGFTLVEVLIAIVLTAVVAAGVAQLFVSSLLHVRSARDETIATLLAAQKVEVLLAAGENSSAMATSPGNSLDEDVTGFVESIDATGQPTVGRAAVGAVFLRRWSVRPLSGTTVPGVVIRVRVLPPRLVVSTASRSRASGEALISTVRTWR